MPPKVWRYVGCLVGDMGTVMPVASPKSMHIRQQHLPLKENILFCFFNVQGGY